MAAAELGSALITRCLFSDAISPQSSFSPRNKRVALKAGEVGRVTCGWLLPRVLHEYPVQAESQSTAASQERTCAPGVSARFKGGFGIIVASKETPRLEVLC